MSIHGPQVTGEQPRRCVSDKPAGGASDVDRVLQPMAQGVPMCVYMGQNNHVANQVANHAAPCGSQWRKAANHVANHVANHAAVLSHQAVVQPAGPHDPFNRHIVSVSTNHYVVGD